MTTNPAIVISAYNRPASLKRLIHSLENAHYDSLQVELIISIDKSFSSEVETIANSIEWKHGKKRIIVQEEHLGLKNHILNCGDLSSEYESIIVLEDDLMVSPFFYRYAIQALDFYKNEEAVAGISLYNYQVAESCFYPFTAIDDGSDVYFMQVASSWGQLWTSKHWKDFKTWFTQNPDLTNDSSIPGYIKQWGDNSWKKHFIHYLVSTNKYFVFPRLSLTTNFEEPGTNASTKNVFHVPLQASEKKYQFSAFNKSKSVYDAWFEISSDSLNQFNTSLSNYNYEVDLYGIKEIETINKEYILTSKQGDKPVLSFGKDLFPLETNIALNSFGNKIGLYKIAGNTFGNSSLNLFNFLSEINKEKESGFSIIIPVTDFNKAHLNHTLESVLFQEAKHIECIIVTHHSNYDDIFYLISNSRFNVRIVTSENNSIVSLLTEGLKNATNGIVTWINAGNSFAPDAFGKARVIFHYHPTINWVRGVNETWNTEDEYNRINTRKYRLVKSEIFKQLKSNTLDFSLEMNFFRKSCMEKINTNTVSLLNLFIQFIESFELRIVVYHFTSIRTPISENHKISDIEKNELINHYQLILGNKNFISSLLNYLTESNLVKDDSSRWYYTSLNNFPDVLRYDFTFKVFYLNKF